MQNDGHWRWDSGPEIPDGLDPYRFWFSRALDEAGTEGFAAPYLVRADSLEELRQRLEMLRETVGTDLFLPELYEKLYFDEASPRSEGPFELVATAGFRSETEARALGTPGVVATSMPLPARTDRAEARLARPPQADFSEFVRSGRKIRRVVALIDSDIAFAHERFRASANSTRIGWFWDMNASAYPLGRMMSSAQIDGYLATLSPLGTGEMRLYSDYARDSYTHPWEALPPPHFGHGTGALDAAVGGEVLNGCDDTTIVCVQLPRFAVAQTHGQFLWLYILAALDLVCLLAWIAEQVQGERPETLVNVSVGGHGGRHDGFSGIARAMDARIGNGDVQAIFLAAGNSYGRRIHARFRGDELDTTRELIWRLQPDDGTDSFLEIWLPDARAEQLGLSVQPPGQSAEVFPAAMLVPGFTRDLFIRGQRVATLAVHRDPVLPWPGVPPRLNVLLSVKSSALARPGFGGTSRGMPELAGDWKIGLVRGESLADDDLVTLWISRDDEILRLPTGARQSFFTAYSPATVNVVNEGTISDMAAGRETTICAAHWASDRMMAPYSGRGIPEADAVAKRDVYPVASFVADESDAHPGVTVAGYFSGSAAVMRGTSVSSPQVLRQALTGQLPNLPGETVRARVASLAQADEVAGADENPVKARERAPIGPPDWGSGRLDFVQRPFRQSGSTNYPRRRRSSF